MYKDFGPDTGLDSIGDYIIAKLHAKFLDKVNQEKKNYLNSMQCFIKVVVEV